jgi:hypothetical protein
MKFFVAVVLMSSFILSSCSTSPGTHKIHPRNGVIVIPAAGEIRMWKEVRHGSFNVKLTNSSRNQSVELYRVNSKGLEKWINPSLLANCNQEMTIPANGHLFIKNFNPDAFSIYYQIAD